MNSKFENLGVKPADILLPKAGTDMHRWAVVACDQFHPVKLAQIHL